MPFKMPFKMPSPLAMALGKIGKNGYASTQSTPSYAIFHPDNESKS